MLLCASCGLSLYAPYRHAMRNDSFCSSAPTARLLLSAPRCFTARGSCCIHARSTSAVRVLTVSTGCPHSTPSAANDRTQPSHQPPPSSASATSAWRKRPPLSVLSRSGRPEGTKVSEWSQLRVPGSGSCGADVAGGGGGGVVEGRREEGRVVKMEVVACD